MLSYLLILRSRQTGMDTNTSLDSNETEVVLSPQDGLEDNQKYIYTVTAINSVGMATSHQDGNVIS